MMKTTKQRKKHSKGSREEHACFILRTNKHLHQVPGQTESWEADSSWQWAETKSSCSPPPASHNVGVATRDHSSRIRFADSPFCSFFREKPPTRRPTESMGWLTREPFFFLLCKRQAVAHALDNPKLYRAKTPWARILLVVAFDLQAQKPTKRLEPASQETPPGKPKKVVYDRTGDLIITKVVSRAHLCVGGCCLSSLLQPLEDAGRKVSGVLDRSGEVEAQQRQMPGSALASRRK